MNMKQSAMWARSAITTTLLGSLIPVMVDAAPIKPALYPVHIINRLSFGFTGTQSSQIKPADIDRYIAEQLNPDTLPEHPEVIKRLDTFDDLKKPPQDIYNSYLFRPDEKAKSRVEGVRFNPNPGFNRVLNEAQEARIIRAVSSRRQLQEVMVDFWFNHFNVFANKGGRVKLAVGDYEERVLRPLALSKFADLLHATAKHPAMLVYLDNWLNTASSSKRKGRFSGLNENYARELLELHTLGVDGGYTQQDVIELARILTGWGLCEGRLKNNASPSGFCFDEQRHDFGEKTLLGKKFSGRGAVEVEDALALLAHHPSTAHHISFKLAQAFVSDTPPEPLVQRLAQRFIETDGDIRAVLKTLFASEYFRDESVYQVKFKSPYRYVISAIRRISDKIESPRPLLNVMRIMNMPLYHCLTPDGYKNTQAAWLGPDTLLQRINFATQLGRDAFSHGDHPILSDKISAIDLEKSMDGILSSSTRSLMTGLDPAIKISVMLASPEFQRY